MKNSILFSSIVLLLTLLSCNTNKKVQQTEIVKQQISENGHHPFKVTEVIEDSRCPKDVDCVWQGQLIVKLGAFLNDKLLDERQVNLSAISNSDIEWINTFLDTNKSKYVYKLVDASSKRLSKSNNIDLEEYKVNIIVQETE